MFDNRWHISGKKWFSRLQMCKETYIWTTAHWLQQLHRPAMQAEKVFIMAQFELLSDASLSLTVRIFVPHTSPCAAQVLFKSLFDPWHLNNKSHSNTKSPSDITF